MKKSILGLMILFSGNVMAADLTFSCLYKSTLALNDKKIPTFYLTIKSAQQQAILVPESPVQKSCKGITYTRSNTATQPAFTGLTLVKDRTCTEESLRFSQIEIANSMLNGQAGEVVGYQKFDTGYNEGYVRDHHLNNIVSASHYVCSVK